MDNLVSIVVPVYNVENYLEKCVASIVNQTYQNIEVILVDDGSKDNSGKLCDELKKRDSRIKIIHKANGGLASARNAGYEKATGKYLMYTDSDDYLNYDIIEQCVSSIEKEDADLVIFGYNKIDESEKVLESRKWGNNTFLQREMIEYLYEAITQMSFGYAWNKLYRKEKIDLSGIMADSQIIDREDLIYNMELLKYLDKITYIDVIGYNYLQRSTSLLHNADLARLKGIEYFVNKAEAIKTGHCDIDKKVFNMNVLHYLSDCIIKNILWNEKLAPKEKKKIIKDVIKSCPHKEDLYEEKEDAAYLRYLCKTVKKNNYRYFYCYVKLSGLKRRMKGG